MWLTAITSALLGAGTAFITSEGSMPGRDPSAFAMIDGKFQMTFEDSVDTSGGTTLLDPTCGDDDLASRILTETGVTCQLRPDDVFPRDAHLKPHGSSYCPDTHEASSTLCNAMASPRSAYLHLSQEDPKFCALSGIRPSSQLNTPSCNQTQLDACAAAMDSAGNIAALSDLFRGLETATPVAQASLPLPRLAGGGAVAQADGTSVQQRLPHSDDVSAPYVSFSNTGHMAEYQSYSDKTKALLNSTTRANKQLVGMASGLAAVLIIFVIWF